MLFYMDIDGAKERATLEWARVKCLTSKFKVEDFSPSDSTSCMFVAAWRGFNYFFAIIC